jgi:hypothetical protein
MAYINPSLQRKVPTSKAKNGYDLCLEVIDAMLEEPKRVNMDYFCLLIGQGEANFAQRPATETPACGTIGCFAGWVNTLTFGRGVSRRWQSQLTKEVLGRKLKYNFRDESGHTQSYFNAGEGDGITQFKAGTPEYAIAVVQRIRRFMKVNAGPLKNRTINQTVKTAALKAVSR